MKRSLVGVLVLLALAVFETPCAAFEEPFPKPAPDAQFAELKVVGEGARPFRRAHEDWEGARSRSQHDPTWVAWLSHERGQVDRWIQYHADHVEWTCGLWHDFVSPKDGSFVTWTDEIPGEQVHALHSPSDPQVEITPRLFNAWVYKFRVAHAEMIARAALLFRLTGDRRYAEWASRQLDFYSDHYLEWAEHHDGSRLYSQTLDVAVGLAQYARAVRILDNYPAPERRERWRREFFRPQAELLGRLRQDINNIATWHRSAQAQVALVFHDEAQWRDAIDGPFGLRQQLRRGITSDYLWFEQSFGYDTYVIKGLIPLFTLAGLVRREGELAAEMSEVENLMLAPTTLRFPDGHAPNPADNPGAAPLAPDPVTFALAYRVFPTPFSLQEAASLRSWDTLLDPPSPAEIRVLPAVTSRNLESSRMALLKSGRWQVFFHYGQLTHSHAQAEALNFSAFYGDTDITHDPGTVGYSSPLHRDYFSKGLNHNVPLFDGDGEVPPQSGELEEFSTSPPRVSASQPAYATGARAERSLAIEGDALVDRVKLTSTQGPRALGLSLHLQGRAVLPPSFISDSEFQKGRPPAFGYWTDVRKATFERRADLWVNFGGKPMKVSFEASGPFTLWHGSSPDIPPAKRDGFYLELVSSASSATISTRISPE